MRVDLVVIVRSDRYVHSFGTLTTLEKFSEKLRNSKDIVFFTGAGISTESGVPDFRSPGGIWAKYQPVYFDDFLTSHEARVCYWKMKAETLELYKDAKPNIGHFSIKAFEDRDQLLGLITQNVDGLHRITGVSEERMVELHGTDRKVACLGCAKEFDPEPIYQRIAEDPTPPVCDGCGGYLKPLTISFGQPMPVVAMRRAQEMSVKAGIYIVIGSSLVVQPAASFPVIAKQRGAVVAIINRDTTPLDELADFIYRGAIGEFFSRLNPLLTQG